MLTAKVFFLPIFLSHLFRHLSDILSPDAPYSVVLHSPRVSSLLLSTVFPLHQELQKPCSPSFLLSSRDGEVQRGQRALCCGFFDPLTGLGIGGHCGTCVSHLRQVQEQTTWRLMGFCTGLPGHPLTPHAQPARLPVSHQGTLTVIPVTWVSLCAFPSPSLLPPVHFIVRFG